MGLCTMAGGFSFWYSRLSINMAGFISSCCTELCSSVMQILLEASVTFFSGHAAWLLGDPCYISKLWQLQTRACGGLLLHGWTGLFNNELWISSLPKKFVVPRNLIISVVFEHFCLLLILGDVCVLVTLLVHEGRWSFASILCSLLSAPVVLARCSDPWWGESCLYHAIVLVVRQPCLFKCSGKVSVHTVNGLESALYFILSLYHCF